MDRREFFKRSAGGAVALAAAAGAVAATDTSSPAVDRDNGTRGGGLMALPKGSWTSVDVLWQDNVLGPTGQLEAIGNGSLAVSMMRTSEAELKFVLRLTFGSTTSPGTHGADTGWIFQVPSVSLGLLPGGSSDDIHIANAMAIDVSTDTRYLGEANILIGSLSEVYISAFFDHDGDGAASQAEAQVPFTWDTGDHLILSNTIRAFAT